MTALQTSIDKYKTQVMNQTKSRASEFDSKLDTEDRESHKRQSSLEVVPSTKLEEVDKQTCNFDNFKNNKVINTLLGASKNPYDPRLKKDKPNSIVAKMSFMSEQLHSDVNAN